MVKPYENSALKTIVYSVMQKSLIIDTSLRSFIPPQVWKITPRLRQICVYDLCRTPMDIQIYLNKLIKKLVIYL